MLPIGGADIVLGIQWLKRLGPIITDYDSLTMQFFHQGHLVEFRADAPTKPTDALAQEVKSLLQTNAASLDQKKKTNAASALFHINISHTDTTPNTHTTSLNEPTPQIEPHSQTDPAIPFLSHPQLEITYLLEKYRALFNAPSEPTPPRNITHKIHLLPNTAPVNVRPYRYPHFQKCEIEKQVEEMLKSGMIQLSQSPFSSPVLLVKKKDGSWRFFVDYR